MNNLDRYIIPRTGNTDPTEIDEVDFDNYLFENSITPGTLKRLKDEDICNFQTLGALSDEDVEELGITIGQKALLRKLRNNDNENSKIYHHNLSNTIVKISEEN